VGAVGAVGAVGVTVAGGGQAVAPVAHAGCLALTAVPEGRVLATLAVGTAPTFDITYIHSVTRTPVVETYRVDHGGLLQTSIVFEQHGPGLPTEPDAGQTWTDRDGHFNVTLARRFDTIRMRVHRDQSPQLLIGSRRVDLAGWGNRAVELRAVSCADAAS
jgi:hypothetical protein